VKQSSCHKNAFTIPSFPIRVSSLQKRPDRGRRKRQAIPEVRQGFITASAFAHLLMPRGIFRQKPTHLTNFGAVEGGRRFVLPSRTDGIAEFCSIERPRTVAHQTFPESRHNPEGEVGLTCLSVRCLSSYLFFRQFQ
jgi:hypothetical protein